MTDIEKLIDQLRREQFERDGHTNLSDELSRPLVFDFGDVVTGDRGRPEPEDK